jgi:dinuclear metal center YbgI/SA1388 family protein
MSTTVRDLLNALERIAPTRYAFGFDRVGLQVGDPSAEVRRVLVSLDRSLAAVEAASKADAQVLLSHHPLIFEPLKSVTSVDHVGKTVQALIRANLSFIAAHTNWDSARGGVNDALLEALDLEFVADFGAAAEVSQLKLAVFAPETHRDLVIEAASAAGAGIIGAYSRCAAFGPVTGTFFGEEGASPAIGSAGRVETVDEVRIEMILPEARRSEVERAVQSVHPYEAPAIDFFRLVSANEQPAGRIGRWSAPLSLEATVTFVQAKLGAPVAAWGAADLPIQTVAVVGGAADGEWRAAQRAGADVLITGEVKQHVALEACESGFAMVAAGHYATEQPGVVALAKVLGNVVAGVEFQVFEPRPGVAGRPL